MVLRAAKRAGLGTAMTRCGAYKGGPVAVQLLRNVRILIDHVIYTLDCVHIFAVANQIPSSSTLFHHDSHPVHHATLSTAETDDLNPPLYNHLLLCAENNAVSSCTFGQQHIQDDKTC